MTFEEAVNKTPEVKGLSKPGLKALGANSTSVNLTNPRFCTRSLDLDAAVANLRPTESRWDYGVEYNGCIYYIEVHPASTGEVATMLAKLDWLRTWLKNHAPNIAELSLGARPYRWAATKGIHILKGSRQERLLAANGLKPESSVTL